MGAAVGCTGGFYTPGSGGASGSGGSGGGGGVNPDCPLQARSYFDTNIAPILEHGTTPVCVSCHMANSNPAAPQFLGQATSQMYGSLMANPRYTGGINTILVTKGMHEGPPLSAAQQSTVNMWLALEQACLGGGGTGGSGGGGTGGSGGMPDAGPPPRPTTCSQALDLFGRCMQRADFDAATMTNVPRQGTLQGPCYSCHNIGQNGNYMSIVADDFYTNLKIPTYLIRFATCSSNPTDGSFRDVVQAHRWRDKGQEGGQHPQYIMTDTRLQYIDQYFNATYAHYQTGVCP